MLNFSDFLSKRDSDFVDEFYFVVERTEAEIEALQIKDGRWTSLSATSGTYVFNVEGDDCSPSMNDPCYEVSIGGDVNNPFYGVGISFYRGGSTQDVRGGHGPEVFKGVEKAIFEFLKKNNPVSLSWSPVRTHAVNPVTGAVTNPEGRRSVYEILSIKSLFPEKYVSVQQNHWIRRDYYDRVFVPNGFPAVPEGLTQSSNPGKKKEAMEKMRKEASEVSSDNQDRLQSAVQREAEEERHRNIRRNAERRHSELGEILEDPVQNPQGLRIGEEAWCPIVNVHQSRITNGNRFEYDVNQEYILRNRAKVEIHEMTPLLFGGSQQLVASVKFHDGYNTNYFASDLLKWESDSQQKVDEVRENIMKERMEDPSINPEKLKVGDKVLFYHFQRSIMGATAVLQEVEFDSYGNIMGVFHIDPNDIASDDPEVIEHLKGLLDPPRIRMVHKLNLANFGGYLKDTPENREIVKKELEQNSASARRRAEEERRRQAEEEQRRRQREEEERRAQERRGREQEAEARIQRGREKRAGQVNAGGFVVGQTVRVTAGPFRGTTGRIVQFRLRPGEPAGQTPPTEAIIRGTDGSPSRIVDVRLLTAAN